MKDDDMTRSGITGPLTERQQDILKRVAEGDMHKTIAEDYEVSRVAIAQNVGRIVTKMGARNTAHAVARYSQEQTLRRVADKLLKGRARDPIGEAEELVNNVLEDFAEALTREANTLRPS